MPQSVDDISIPLLRAATWRKSRHSNPNGNCVELADLAGGRIAVRNSRHPGGSVQIYARAQIAAFVRRAKKGEFDGTIGWSSAR